MNVEINILLEDEKGNIVTEGIKINSNNPQTGDSITIYMSIAIISAVTLIYIAAKKNKKSNRGKRFIVFLIAVAILTPITARASGDALSFNFKSTFALKDKLVLTYTNASGVEETVVVKYGETIPVPGELEKTGYNFIGWYYAKEEKIEGEISNITDDLKLIPKSELKTYTISYELDGGNADTTNTYTIESDDITLLEPEKKGYTLIQLLHNFQLSGLEQQIKQKKENGDGLMVPHLLAHIAIGMRVNLITLEWKTIANIT